MNRWLRRLTWMIPVVLALGASIILRQQQQGLEEGSSSVVARSGYNTSSAFLLVSKPQNSISISIIRQLQPATVYVVYPPSEKKSIAKVRDQLPSTTQWCPLDPFGKDRKDVQKQLKPCLTSITSTIDGVIFNHYGVVGNGSISDHPSLVQFKLTNNLILLDSLLDSSPSILNEGAKIIFSGSESARGLPKMGFPVPNLGNTPSSIQSFLTGEAYIHDDEQYQWEKAYSDLSAVLVFYVRYISRIYPQYYFAVVSPGMTEESLRLSNSPNPSLGWRLQLFLFRFVMFGLLQKWEIIKTSKEGASLMLQALMGWEYPSGSFVGARGGTGGPICDQTELDGGKMFLDEKVQKMVHHVLQLHIEALTG